MVLLVPVFLMRHKDTKSPGGPGTTGRLMQLQGKLSYVCFREMSWGGGWGAGEDATDSSKIGAQY